jgi:hypothetical protein
MVQDSSKLRDWDSLEAEEQTSIQVEYGYYLDTLPPTCSLESKIERFRHWLKTEKNIHYKS